MKRALLVTLLALAPLVFAGGAAGAGTQPRVLAIQFGPDLEVNPVTQDYLTHQLSHAANDGYDAAVILLDTPGGLSTSMKTIYKAELEREAAGDRLRLARRRARRLGRRLDLAGGRRARDGADLEHRLLDADRLERAEPRLATCAAR